MLSTSPAAVTIFFSSVFCLICLSSAGEDGFHLVGWHFPDHEKEILLTTFITFVAMFKLIYGYMPHFVTYVPESVMLIVIGALFGYFKTMIGGTVDFTMTPTLFFNYLLPPIIIDSSFCIYHRVFADNIVPILLIAVFGTMLNFFLIGTIIYFLEQFVIFGISDISMNLAEVLLFSSVIVAIDPVAVLVIFQEIGVDEGLYYLVFGEALLNDAVTIVLYNIMKVFASSNTRYGILEISKGIMSFGTVSIGGLIVGIIFGLLCSLLTRFTHRMPNLEPLFIFTFGYMAYSFGDMIQWSGIIATIGCGVVQSAYAFKNLDSKSQIAAHSFASSAAAVTESLIFLFLGVELCNGLLNELHIGFACWSITLCLMVRTMITFLLTFISNLAHLSSETITFSENLIISWGGLRGAVSYSLAASYNDPHTTEKYQQILKSTTLFIVLFTCIVFGGTMKPIVNLFQIRLSKPKMNLFDEINRYVLRQANSGMGVVIGVYSVQTWLESFYNFNDQYLRKIFQRNPMQSEEKILKVFEEITMNEAFQYTHLPSFTYKNRSSSVKPPCKSIYANRIQELYQHSDNSFTAAIDIGETARTRSVFIPNNPAVYTVKTNQSGQDGSLIGNSMNDALELPKPTITFNKKKSVIKTTAIFVTPPVKDKPNNLEDTVDEVTTSEMSYYVTNKNRYRLGKTNLW